MSKLGKRIKEARKLVNPERVYTLEEASELLTTFPKVKFDESVDVAVRLGIDPKKAEENLRSTVTLPHGTGKTVRVAVFCKGEKAKEAEDAGADYVGLEDLVEKIQGGWLEFDAVVAAPDCMAQVGKIGKLLGPRGLMPNPKVGSVTPEVGKAVKAIKEGRVEYRVDKIGVMRLAVAKASFGGSKIKENIVALLDSVVRNKPKTSKGIYLQSIHISTTKGPAVKVDPAPFRDI